MTNQCEITGKKACKGKRYSRRGIAKKKKGIGLNITGKSKRRFTPNIQTVSIYCSKLKRYVKRRVSTSAMRTLRKQSRNKI